MTENNDLDREIDVKSKRGRPFADSARLAKTHSQERLEVLDDRASRPVNRDVEIIKMPGGLEYVRTPRTSLKRTGSLSDLPKKPGFKRRWVSENIPNRIQDLIDLGYKPATDENGREIAPIRGGINKKGETFSRYAMEISEEMDAKIERDKKEKIRNKQQNSLESMKNVDLGSGSMTYVKNDYQKSINL